jgi:hypothetical protein
VVRPLEAGQKMVAQGNRLLQRFQRQPCSAAPGTPKKLVVLPIARTR